MALVSALLFQALVVILALDLLSLLRIVNITVAEAENKKSANLASDRMRVRCRARCLCCWEPLCTEERRDVAGADRRRDCCWDCDVTDSTNYDETWSQHSTSATRCQRSHHPAAVSPQHFAHLFISTNIASHCNVTAAQRGIIVAQY